MSADYRQLTDFTRRIERLNDQQKEEFLKACCKELAARLLTKVIKCTPVVSGTLRRGWTAGTRQNASAYANSLEIRKIGNKYLIDVVNPVEWASYVEYGHRTVNHQGWVPGKFMLTISENELNEAADVILQKKLNRFMRDVFA